MNYGSVCSGIEAATMAWHPLGWKPSFFSEIDKFPRAVLEHHYPEVPLHGDFTTIEDGTYEPIDLLVGGTPCQSFSVAGLRKGLDDERGNLALEYLRLAQRLRPRWVVWENVPGVLSSGGGRDFGAFLGGLVELGYGFSYRVLDAQYIRVESHPYAVPQRRRRVFVVGCLGDWRRAAAVLLEPESLRRDSPPSRETREVAPTIPARSTGGGGLRVAHTLRGAGFDASEDGAGRGTPLVTDCPSVSPAIKARDHKGPSSDGDGDGAPILPVAIHGTQDPDVLVGCAHTLGRNSGQENALAFDTTQITHPENRSNPQLGDPCHPLAAEGHAPAVALNLRGREGGASLEISEGVSTALRSADGGSTQPMTLTNAVRRLTPKECERLQGFPDDFTKIPYRGRDADKCPDGPRYKALGNSMAVNVMSWIGRRIAIMNEVGRELAEDELVELVVGIN